MSSPIQVEVRRHLPATPAEVFRWWTLPDRLAEWMSPIGTAEAVVDLRPGGSFRIVMKGDGIEIAHQGEYLEIEPPHRLMFTWRSPYTGDEATVVLVELQPAAGGTDLRLIHRRLPTDVRESHRRGWAAMVDRLASVLAARPVPKSSSRT